MLTLHTSSEEEKILYLRKFAQNIRNNNEGPQLLEDRADWQAFYGKLWKRRPQVPNLANSSLPFPPPDWSPNLLEETLLEPVLKSFITVFIIMTG